MILVACGEDSKDDGRAQDTAEGTTASTTTSPTASQTTTPTPSSTPTTSPTATTTPTASTTTSPTTSTTPPGELTVCINEFMAANQVALEVDGAFPDWIELHNPGSDPVDLEGWGVSDDADEPNKHLLEGPLVLPPGGFLLLFADGAPDLGPAHLSFGLASEGETVALHDPWGNGSVVHYGPMGDDIAASRETDCCEDKDCWTYPLGGSPGASNEPPELVTEVVLEAGSTWSASATLAPPEAGWSRPVFDDSAWISGPAPMGFGDAHIVTELPSGDPDMRFPAVYFRHIFHLEDAADVEALRLGILRDDGVVVYLNGMEVVRNNMGPGAVSHITFATADIEGADETTYAEMEVPAGLLLEGDNLLAVEVHQSRPDSDDLGFDLTLELDRWEAP
jgi:hypothetical protein